MTWLRAFGRWVLRVLGFRTTVRTGVMPAEGYVVITRSRDGSIRSKQATHDVALAKRAYYKPLSSDSSREFYANGVHRGTRHGAAE